MKKLMGSLRMRLAVTSFLASYVPVLVLLIGVGASSSDEEVIAPGFDPDTGAIDLGNEVVFEGGVSWTPVFVIATLLLPAAAFFAWWWSGRAVRPIERAIVAQDQLIEETSHELRTPLAVLTNNADVLLDQAHPTIDDFRVGLERSRSAARRMTATLDALLVDARGRARTIVRQPADMTAITKRAVEGVELLAQRAEVGLQLASSAVVRARVDRLSLERAVTNLLTNAIQASPRGGRVTIKVSIEGDQVSVSVIDDGPGVAEADQATVFERYWHGDSEAGSGIGLDVARQIALAHGGDIDIRSPVVNGRGTEFCLRVTA